MSTISSAPRISSLSGSAKNGSDSVVYLCYVLFAIGVFFYVAALFFIGDSTGETLSDVANAVLLITAVLLLLRLSAKGSREPASQG
ncbi:MAG: hypothetical protein ACYTFI_19560 [Planctomycetota bacterium]|jgi:hypothetical protein